MNKTCNRCKKPIKGRVAIRQHRKKIGNKSIVQVEYYDEDCFYYINLEEAKDEAKRNNKNKN